MKKIRRTNKVIPLLLLTLILTFVPLAGIACDDDKGSDGPFTFEMQCPYGENDASGIALKNFKELVEEKTGGRITINASYNGQPIAHTDQFKALQTDALDLAVQQPGYSRTVDNNFDFSGALVGLIVTKEHYQAVLANDDYIKWYSDLYEDKGIKFLGIVDGYRFSGGYLTSFPIDSLWDFQGHEIWNGRSGGLEPYEELLGCTAHVFAERSELPTKVTNGDIDIIAIPALYAFGGAWQTPGITDYIVRPFYAPYSILVSLDTWEKMSSELQNIITDEVMPALKQIVEVAVIEQAKVAVPGLVDALGKDHVHVVPASEEDSLYNQLIDYEPFKNRAASMDQDMYELIKGLRPATTTWDQDILDVLVLAGLIEVNADTGEITIL